MNKDSQEVTLKYYHGEEASPIPREDVRSKFWWGEMMFVTNDLSVTEWKQFGEEILKKSDKRAIDGL